MSHVRMRAARRLAGGNINPRMLAPFHDCSLLKIRSSDGSEKDCGIACCPQHQFMTVCLAFHGSSLLGWYLTLGHSGDPLFVPSDLDPGDWETGNRAPRHQWKTCVFDANGFSFLDILLNETRF